MLLFGPRKLFQQPRLSYCYNEVGRLKAGFAANAGIPYEGAYIRAAGIDFANNTILLLNEMIKNSSLNSLSSPGERWAVTPAGKATKLFDGTSKRSPS